MKATIFYSWQSDLPANTNRYFIEKCITQAIKKIQSENELVLVLDRDTLKNLGSPNILESIFKKIDKCHFFVCDVSFISETIQYPNPNVLIELGYAIKTLGWNRIICLFNKDYGDVDSLPFDINHNRITTYSGKNSSEKNRLAEIININIKSLFYEGKLFNPLVDYMKQKIDYNFLYIIERIIHIFNYDSNSINFGTELSRLDSYSKEKLISELDSKSFLSFFFFQDYSTIKDSFEDILNKLFMSNYFADTWKEVLVEIIEWLIFWEDFISERFSPNLVLIEKMLSNYKIEDMHKVNSSNPENSILLLRALNEEKYVVVKSGYITCSKETATALIKINPKYSEQVIAKFKLLLNIIFKWLDITGGEFILSPRFYKLGNKSIQKEN